jgi:quinohemoprotein ethanol dehydrogenase
MKYLLLVVVNNCGTAIEQESFAAVVRDGDLVARRMPGTPGITDAQLEALRHDIRQRARETL